jgi:hypothetical protein
MLKRCQFVLALALLAALSLQAAAQKAFAGVWEAKFKDRVFCVLKVDMGDGITGTLSPGRITVNDQGDITDAEPSTPEPSGHELPILNPKVRDNTLSFDWKEDDEEATQFEMKITGEGEAELRLLNTEGHPIKPIRLKRR